jgi:hypothetical protein
MVTDWEGRVAVGDGFGKSETVRSIGVSPSSACWHREDRLNEIDFDGQAVVPGGPPPARITTPMSRAMRSTELSEC